MKEAEDKGFKGKAAVRAIVRISMILVCLWLVVLIAIQIVLSPKMVDRLIDKYASEYIDGQIHIGRASMSVFRHFPNIGMTLEDFDITYPSDRYDSLEIKGAQGHLALKGLGEEADTLASFRRLSASVNVAALLRGRINVPYAELVRPRIFIHRYEDGSSNLDIIQMPQDTTGDEESSGMPELKLGRIGLSEHPHIVYTDSRDTIFAVADLKQVRLNGRLNPGKSSRNRVGIRLDSLFVAGRVSADTLAFGLEQLGIRERHKEMIMHAKAKALLATRAFGRMNIPIEIKSRFSFPQDEVPAIDISGLEADIASVPLSGSAGIRLLDDRASIKAALAIEECRISDVIDDFLKSYIPSLKDIRTDASVSLTATCDGDYIYADGTLPAFEAHISVPESEISHKAVANRMKVRLEATAANNPADSCISASIDTVEIRSQGLELKATGSVPDIMEEDMLIHLHGDMDADLAQLRTFLPDTMNLEAAGSFKAHILGNIRMSQMDIYNFSQAQLEGKMEGKDIRIQMPGDSLDVNISNFDIALGPETKTSKRDSSMTFKLMAIKGSIDNASIDYGLMALRGQDVTISAMNSADGGGAEKVSRLGGRLLAKSLVMNDASGMEVELKETANGFQMFPKKERPDIPVLTVSSTNKHIYYKDGTNRAILTDADIHAMAAMNTVERRQRMRMFMDSLAKMYPDVPRDSLMIHMAAQRKTRELPEWMSEEDFRKKDINIKLDETLAKYFREWDMNGKLDIRTGIVMTPYFPLTNIIRGFEVQFDNDKIAIDSVKFKSGKSEIAGKGSLTGLRRALLGRGGLNLDLDVSSDKINANELLTAYNTGSRYVPPQDKETVNEASNAEFLKMVVKDTVNVTDSVTPLIVIPSNLNADINLNASNITYSDVTVSNLGAKLTMKERCVQITQTKAVSNIGDISFEGFYATRSKKNIKAGFSFNFEDITAEKVIDMIPAVDSIMPLLKSFNGNLNCELAATASIDTNMNIIPPSINGVIRIGGRDLSIKESEMFQDLAKKLMFKNKKEGYIKEMSVEGVISDSVLEVFPFVLKLDRYTLALSGLQNLDMSFKYHASLLKSPFLIRLGIDLYGNSFDDMKFKIGKAKYKNTDVPVFSAVIDTTKINLVNSIRGIFEKGVEAAVSENEQKAAIEKHKQDIGYVRAVDQELEALTEKEQKQMEAEEAVLKETEAAEEALGKAIQQISLNLPAVTQEEKDEKQEKK